MKRRQQEEKRQCPQPVPTRGSGPPSGAASIGPWPPSRCRLPRPPGRSGARSGVPHRSHPISTMPTRPGGPEGAARHRSEHAKNPIERIGRVGSPPGGELACLHGVGTGIRRQACEGRSVWLSGPRRVFCFCCFCPPARYPAYYWGQKIEALPNWEAFRCKRNVSRFRKAANCTTKISHSQSPSIAGLSIVHFCQSAFHMVPACTWSRASPHRHAQAHPEAFPSRLRSRPASRRRATSCFCQPASRTAVQPRNPPQQ